MADIPIEILKEGYGGTRRSIVEKRAHRSFAVYKELCGTYADDNSAKREELAQQILMLKRGLIGPR